MSAEELKEFRDELRTVSDGQIRLEEQLKAHMQEEKRWQEREQEYHTEFIKHITDYQQKKMEISENTNFRKAAIWHIRAVWVAVIGAIVGSIKFVFLSGYGK